MSTGNGTTIELTCEAIEELLPLHVLGLVDEHESLAVEAHLVLCPACSAAAIQYEAVTGALPLALDPIAVDPAIRNQLMDRLDSPAAPLNVTSITDQRANRGRAWKSIAAAAVLLLTLGGGGFWINNLMNERDDARDTLAMVQEFVSPNALAVAMVPMPASQWDWGSGSSRLLKNPSGAMMLVVEGCPPTADDRTYVAWVAVGEQRLAVGEIVIDDDGTGWMPVTFPDDMPEPEILGVSMRHGEEPLVDLFLGEMTG